jgi:DNA-binding NtrC family response regulator
MAMEAQSSQATAPLARRPSVLFVDDEQSILTTMRIMFRRNYDVYLASNGKEALELLARQDVDVIVSDQRMPGMMGVEVLREARRLRPRAMRVLLTGYSDFSAIVGSINDGEIYRFVHKPWSNAEFQSIIGQAAAASQQMSADQATLLNESEDVTAIPASAGRDILVLDTDTVSVDELQRALGGDYNLHHATSIASALDILEQHRIGVLLVETMIGNESVSTLLSLLKQHHPHVVSIVLTHRSDANMAIDLINRGQIFRFLLKPVRAAMTTRSVGQAMQRHQTLASNPILTQRYKVQTQDEAAPVSQTAAVAQASTTGDAASSQSLVQRIIQLRGRLGSWV